MSVQTRMARAEAAAALDGYRRHVKICAMCRDAKDRKQPGRRCSIGQQLAASARDLGRAARRQEELDRKPMKGQAALW